jgi:hypothetical protein
VNADAYEAEEISWRVFEMIDACPFKVVKIH